MSTPSTERRSGFRRKPVEAFVSETAPDAEGGKLSRSIGLFQLTMFGVGATTGTGIFIVLTDAVSEAGPGVIVAFALAGITAALTAVCYAELASTIPISGSSYSYTYATMGEIVAFGVAACLLLEYGVSAAAVAVGWAQYLNELLFDLFGYRLPGAINAAPGEGGFFNLPAIVLVTLCGLLLIRGVRDSATANAIMVLFHRVDTRALAPVRNTLIVCAFVGLLAARRTHRPDEHGNPGRIHSNLDRGDNPAPYPARLASRVQRPRLPGNAHTRRCLRPLPDLRSAVHYVRAVRGVARGRGHNLLHLQSQTLTAGQGEADATEEPQ